MVFFMIITSPRKASEILSRPDSSRIPYTFSTDIWSSDVVRELKERFENMQTPRENAVGVFIGPGGLPYVLAYAGISKAYMADIHAEAILANMIRIGSFVHHQSWLKYRNAFSECLSGRDNRRFTDESSRAAQSSLMEDYALTRQGAESTALWGVAGDFLKTSPYIAQLAANRGEIVTFVNVTNAADSISTEQIESGGTLGMLVLGRAIGCLPLASDVVIVDSSGNFVPKIFSKESYPGVQLGEFLSSLSRIACEHSG
jgi:hypothetical protein